MGVAGCALALPTWYYLIHVLSPFLGIEDNLPIRQHDTTIQIMFFASLIITLALCLYVFGILSALIYFGVKYKKGHLSKKELFNIAFKFLYPERWQNGFSKYFEHKEK